MQITALLAREILDSRGQPTVEAEIQLKNGVISIASVPSGASTGTREALELRDGDAKRYHGKGVLTAVQHIKNIIAPALQGHTIADQAAIDQKLIALDGTENKNHLGANAILAVSLAVAKARALSEKQPLFRSLMPKGPYSLPVPLMNIINGGAHANNGLNIQEFMIVPHGAPTFREALRMGSEVFMCLKSLLHHQGLSTAVGDEGGFAPVLPHHRAAIELILEAIHKAGYRAGKEISLALDTASSEFYHEGKYHLTSEQKILTAAELVGYFQQLTEAFPIISIEDGMAEQDFEGWRLLTNSLGQKIQLVGDDLFVTNAKIFKEGISQKLGNAILIKLNQIGTLTETLETIALAKASQYRTIISHRSGETEETFIADLAVATDARQIKTGSLCRTDRVAKYNQLLRIEELLGKDAVYAGTLC